MKKVNILLLIYILCIFGWIRNIYKLTQCDFDTPLKTEVVRLIAIPVFPLGMIIGYLNIGEE